MPLDGGDGASGGDDGGSSNDRDGSTDEDTNNGSTGNGDNANASSTGGSNNSGGTGANGQLERSDLIGKWISGCRSDYQQFYGLNELEFTDSKITSRYRQFEGDATCTDEAKVVTDAHAEDRDWKLVGVTDQGLTKLDSINVARKFNLLSSKIASDWSSGSGCGPFTAKQEKDVSGLRCFDYTYPPIGGTVYDVVAIVNGKLSFGAPSAGDMNSEQNRPTSLETRVGRDYSRLK
jgi:hypothetical protein